MDHRKFLMLTYPSDHNGREVPKWCTLREAGVLFSNNWMEVKIGDFVDEEDRFRRITREERQEIINIADEWSENK